VDQIMGGLGSATRTQRFVKHFIDFPQISKSYEAFSLKLKVKTTRPQEESGGLENQVHLL